MEHSGLKFKLRPSALTAQVEKQQEKSKEILQQQQQQKGQALCEPAASSTAVSPLPSTATELPVISSGADAASLTGLDRPSSEPSVLQNNPTDHKPTAIILTNNIGCAPTANPETLAAITPGTSSDNTPSSSIPTSTANGESVTKLNRTSDEKSITNDVKDVNGASGACNNPSLNSNNEEASSAIPGFVFGQNLAERVILSPSKSSTSEETDDSISKPDSSHEKSKSAETIDTGKTDMSTDKLMNPIVIKPAFSSSSTNCPSSSGPSGSSATMSNSHGSTANNSSSKRKYEAITGEEDESNVLQIHCRLYHWEADETGASSHSWREKGRGFLKLNDRKSSETSEKFTSRLVMRTAGSLKLILNASLVSGMTFSKSSESSIRFTNHDGIYSIKGKEKDIDVLHSAVEYRMRELAKKVKADGAAVTKCSAFSRIDGDDNSDPSSKQSIDRVEAPDDENEDDESEKKEDKEDEDDSTTSTVAREIDDGTSDSQAPVMSSSESNSQT